MELRQLRIFRTVASTLNFTRAAEILNYAQSNVTSQIKALEEELGVHLFDRLGKRVTLTTAGNRLLSYAEHLLGVAEEARMTVAGGDEPSGSLTVGMAETLCTYRLPPILQRFTDRYPKVQITIRPIPSITAMKRELTDGLVDAVFLLDEPTQAPNLVVECLVPESLLLIAHPRHHLARRSWVGAADLEGERVLAFEKGCSYRSVFERVLAEAGVHPETTLEFGSLEALKHCVMAGMGLSVLPFMAAAAEIEQERLVALPWAGPPVSVVTQVARHKDKWLSPAFAAFLEITREEMLVSDAGLSGDRGMSESAPWAGRAGG